MHNWGAKDLKLATLRAVIVNWGWSGKSSSMQNRGLRDFRNLGVLLLTPPWLREPASDELVKNRITNTRTIRFRTASETTIM
jgi:hypothetical protein